METSVSEESRWVKNNALNAMIDILPSEMQAPLDNDADKDKNRQKKKKADRILAERMFSRMLYGETPEDERTSAMMMACCIVSTITFEKNFSRISKAIRRRKQKKNSKNLVNKRRIKNG